VLLKVLPQDTESPAVPVNMGFDGSVKSRRRSRDPKRRDEKDLPWYEGRLCLDKDLYFASGRNVRGNREQTVNS
jgi:hypothetical protein